MAAGIGLFEAEAGAPIEVKGKERPLVPWRIVAERVVHRAGEPPTWWAGPMRRRVRRPDRGLPTTPSAAAWSLCAATPASASRAWSPSSSIRRAGSGLDCHSTSILDFGARDRARRYTPLDAKSARPGRRCRRSQPRQGHRRLRSAPGGGAARALPLRSAGCRPAHPGAGAAVGHRCRGVREKVHTRRLCDWRSPIGSSAPMLLLVEDIHWADAWTLDQLAALAAQAPSSPCC